jgi:hypothetical protein
MQLTGAERRAFPNSMRGHESRFRIFLGAGMLRRSVIGAGPGTADENGWNRDRT